MKAKNNQAIDQEIKDIHEAAEAIEALWLKYSDLSTREGHELSKKLYEAMDALEEAERIAKKIKGAN